MLKTLVAVLHDREAMVFVLQLVIFGGLCHLTLSLERTKEMERQANFVGFLLLLFVLLFMLSQ